VRFILITPPSRVSVSREDKSSERLKDLEILQTLMLPLAVAQAVAFEFAAALLLRHVSSPVLFLALGFAAKKWRWEGSQHLDS